MQNQIMERNKVIKGFSKLFESRSLESIYKTAKTDSMLGFYSGSRANNASYGFAWSCFNNNINHDDKNISIKTLIHQYLLKIHDDIGLPWNAFNKASMNKPKLRARLEFLMDIDTAYFAYQDQPIYFIRSMLRLIGSGITFDAINGVIKKGDEIISVKHFGRISQLNKLNKWSVLAEKISHKLKSNNDYSIDFYTDYFDLYRFYTDDSASGSSCMAKEFNNLRFHPCAVYAHDLAVHAINDGVSKNIKLAVLSECGIAVSRCMVQVDQNGNVIRHANFYGKKSSLFSKLLNGVYPKAKNQSFDGHINLLEYDSGFIMPYIDNTESICCETGLIGGDGLRADKTGGYVSQGVWSDWYGEFIDEEQSIYSEHLSDYIHIDEAVRTYCEDYLPEGHDDLFYSEHEQEYFISGDDSFIYLEFLNDYVFESSVEELAIEHIENNASISELLDFANSI
jgi:hypothetical protein